MAKASLSQVVGYCNRTLKTAEIEDYDGAVNGLQVENNGTVHRLAASVDASLATIRRAVMLKADLLLVHHGLFWNAAQPWTGRRRELIRLLVQNNLAVYSSHLPLDAHPRLGNNAHLAGLLGLRNLKPFFPFRGRPIGFQCRQTVNRAQLIQRLAQATGAPPIVLPSGPTVCRRIGVVTGGAGADLKVAAEEGVDTFITGEGPHWTSSLAQELEMNVLYGGHYATETFGVKALAGALAARFKVPWVFIDCPTGL